VGLFPIIGLVQEAQGQVDLLDTHPLHQGLSRRAAIGGKEFNAADAGKKLRSRHGSKILLAQKYGENMPFQKGWKGGPGRPRGERNPTILYDIKQAARAYCPEAIIAKHMRSDNERVSLMASIAISRSRNRMVWSPTSLRSCRKSWKRRNGWSAEVSRGLACYRGPMTNPTASPASEGQPGVPIGEPGRVRRC
jgi:hypothetical protein